MSAVCQNFFQVISCLKVGTNMWKFDNTMTECISDIKAIYFDVFYAFMVDRIGSNLNDTFVISMKWSRII